MKRVGIVGFGSFGAFAARVLAPHAEVLVHSNQQPNMDVQSVPLEAFASVDIVILAIPLNAYEDVLAKLRPILRPETLIVDVCSVKVQSRDTVFRLLPNHSNFFITHPLFGPQSAANGTEGHDIIVTDVVGELAERCVLFCEQVLGLKVTRISAEEHDRVMAYVHVLTFFVARGLRTMNIPELPFKTPSFDELTDLMALDAKHSDELFRTIQQGNPYGQEVRRQLVGVFEELEQQLK